MTDCPYCRETKWVCEAHPNRPWTGEGFCGCGSAGMPCPECQPETSRDQPPVVSQALRSVIRAAGKTVN